MRTGGQEENLVRLGEVVIGAALKVHSRLGPGLLEGIYETCLIHELRTQGLTVESQRVLPVIYEGLVLDSAFRLDVLVDKLGNYPLGYFMNFNEVHLKNGIKRVCREV